MRLLRLLEAQTPHKPLGLKPDQLLDELVLIQHHLGDIESALADEDIGYAEKGLADVGEAVARLAKFLPADLRDELERATHED